MNIPGPQQPDVPVVYIEAGAVGTNNDIEAKYPKNQVKGLSISLLVFGAIPVIFDIIALYSTSRSGAFFASAARSLTSTKLAFDLLPICTGITGLVSTNTPTKAKLVTCMIFAIISSIYSGILFLIYIIVCIAFGFALHGATTDNAVIVIAIALLIIYPINMALSIRCAVCCCRGTGCCCVDCCCGTGGGQSSGVIHSAQYVPQGENVSMQMYPTTGAQMYPTTGAQMYPPSGAQMYPNTGGQMYPNVGDQMYPTKEKYQEANDLPPKYSEVANR